MNRIAIITTSLVIICAALGIWMVWGRQPETQPAAVKVATLTAKAAVQGNLKTLHVVKKGESLYRISRRYGVSVLDIQNANRDKSQLIKVGQVLVIPKK